MLVQTNEGLRDIKMLLEELGDRFSGSLPQREGGARIHGGSHCGRGMMAQAFKVRTQVREIAGWLGEFIKSV